jgi:hypothetical protein
MFAADWQLRVKSVESAREIDQREVILFDRFQCFLHVEHARRHGARLRAP